MCSHTIYMINMYIYILHFLIGMIEREQVMGNCVDFSECCISCPAVVH